MMTDDFEGILRRDIPRYWRSINPSRAFLTRLERMEMSAERWETSLLRRVAFRWGSLHYSIQVVATMLMIFVLTFAGTVGVQAARELWEIVARIGATGLTSRPVVVFEGEAPMPAPLLSREQAQARVSFPIRVPAYLPPGIEEWKDVAGVQQPVQQVFQVVQTEDGRNLVIVSYLVQATGASDLKLLETETGSSPLFLLDAYRCVWGAPRESIPQDTRTVELKPGVVAEWAESGYSGPGPWGEGDFVLTNLLWQEDGVTFFLSGPYSLEELLKVARSLE
ncbi:MAG: hypothetical protein H5T62_00585 [Anaerolineae bacterium]|nr:hypothetical protein [Anaerolineae bacterium]